MDQQAIDPHVSLAFSLHSVRGGYVVLLGAGVSIAAGMPSAWEVQRDLICSLAAARKVDLGEADEDAPFAWYQREYGKPATYDDLLGLLAQTPGERQGLLRSYFEASQADQEQGLKQPSAAHRAVAALVKSEHVRVILTLNFDRLMETALRMVGIEPTVLSTPADVAGMSPLHLQEALVVHLHGDYLNPASMLNTTEELAAYAPEIDRLLDRICDEYGLVIAGWSAKWDTALRAAVSRCATRRFTSYWVDPFNLPEEGMQLLNNRRAVHVQATADTFLAGAVEALTDIARANRHPAGVGLAVGRAKRELAGGRPAIELHDALRVESARLADHPLRGEPASVADHQGEHERRLAAWEAAAELYLALVATAAYWGSEATDRFWVDDIEHLAQRSMDGGITKLVDLVRVPATMAFYAAGVAAAAAGRWPLVARLLEEPQLPDPYKNLQPFQAAVILRPDRTMGLGDGSSARLYRQLKPILSGHLGLGDRPFRDAWERFEYLCLITQFDAGTSYPASHIRAVGKLDAYEAAPAAWVQREIDQGLGDQLPLNREITCDPERLKAAKGAVDQAFSEWANQRFWSVGGTGHGTFYPDGSGDLG